MSLDKLLLKRDIARGVAVGEAHCGLRVLPFDQNLFVLVALLDGDLEFLRAVSAASFVKSNLNFALKLISFHGDELTDGIVRCWEKVRWVLSGYTE